MCLVWKFLHLVILIALNCIKKNELYCIKLDSVSGLSNKQWITNKGQKNVINQKLMQTNSKFTIGPKNKLNLVIKFSWILNNFMLRKVCLHLQKLCTEQRKVTQF